MAEKKLIAKNTLVLYFRMMITMLIGLYMSRVVLEALGEIDYGVYNIVGDFVTMFGFISGAMVTATQRFLSFEIGKGEEGNVKAVFSTAVIIHMRLAAAVLIVGEVVGVWFLNTRMNIPADRYAAANWVFQMSLLTFVINIYSVPYNATIVAYERMTAFAYVSIVEAVLKLGVAIFITISSSDKLIMYAVLLACIALLVRIIYGVYVSRNFEQCVCTWHINKRYSKEMTSFVGWNLIGSIANISKDQGINLVLNHFFGTTINAARGLATKVMGLISSFATNFQMALNPQIIKSYAAEQMEEMFDLVFKGSKLSYLLLLFLSLPVFIEADFLLSIWLVKVPEYTVVFLRLVIATVLFDSLSNSLITAMHASGKVKEYQIVVGSISLLTLPCVYWVLSMGYTPEWAMIVGLIFSFICHIARLVMLHISIGMPVMRFLVKVTMRVLATTACAAILPLYCYTKMEQGVTTFVVICGVSVLSSIASIFILGLNNDERRSVLEIIKKRLKRGER